MVQGKGNKQVGHTDQMKLKIRFVILPRVPRRVIDITQVGPLVENKMEDKDKRDKRKYKNVEYDMEDAKDEESDTEDSYDLEVTPEQLKQVVPGG